MFQESVVDGVPVVWVAGPEPLSASLVFRVGVRDETVRTTGITHLVEHLAMSTIGRRRHQLNASVDVAFTEFTASGSPGGVVTYLEDVCQALAALPLDRLATEAKVLRAEEGAVTHPAVAEHLAVRYGLRGAGLAGFAPPAIEQLTPAEVTDFAARFFVRENAILALTGPPPDGLRLPLPSGAGAAVPHDEHLPVTTPAWFEHAGPATSLSFVSDVATPKDHEALLAVLRVALDRSMDQLRHERGWLYDIDFSVVPTRRDQAVVCFFADPPPEHADDVRRGLLGILDGLRQNGPTQAELAEDHEALVEHHADPRAVEGSVASAARGLLLGEEVLTPDEQISVHAALTPEQCAAPLSALPGSYLVGMPPERRPDDPALREVPQTSPDVVDGASFGRSPITGRVQRVPRGARLVIGEDGVSLCLREGPQTVRWDALVGVARDRTNDITLLMGADGMSVPFAARWFRKGQEARDLIEARIRPDLEFDDQDGEQTARG